MGKKIIFFAMLLLPVTFSFAQISMKGHLQQFFGHGIAHGLVECSGKVLYSGVYLPTYKPKTKSVTIKKRELTYDSYEEKWRDVYKYNRYEGYKVEYDTLGRIVYIFFHWDDCYSCIEDGDWDYGYRFEYEDGRLVEIKKNSFGSDTSYRGAIKIKYNANGVVSKILIREQDLEPDEVRVKWNPQGFLSQIQKYKNGEPYRNSIFPSTVSYQVTQNGKSIMEISGSKRNQITKDEHGAAKRYKDEYYENKYDEDGNLIQQILYRIIGGEMVYESRWGFYKGGCSFEYEYEFYE